MSPLKVFKETPTLSVIDWRDRRADERLWMLTKSGLKPGVLIVRHVGNSIWRKGALIARKKSDLFGIELITAGNLRFVQNGKEYIVDPGNIIIKKRGGNHLYEPGPAGYVHKRFIRLDGPIVETIAGELGIDQIDVCPLSHPQRFATLQKRAIMLTRDQPEGYVTQLSLLAFEVLLFVAQDLTGSRYPAALYASIDYMRRNLHQKIAVSDLSRTVGVSDTQLFRLFKSHLGESPLAFFNNMKIKRAGELLRHTLIPLKEIAFSLGYEEPAYFTNQFKKAMDMSPREYRKKI
ncbi:MAG: helix-turn-helix transcriptional regulator [Chitinispirillaceae bacterium]|nr:helix-turn-helix transcriptional regulator [Chitinispirillaceae bacterium]